MIKLSMEELNRKTTEEFRHAEKIPVIVVLENIRSMHNVGSVFRSADAFLIEAIYLCGYTAQPPRKEIEKTALGATETVEWKYFSTTKLAIEALKQDHYRVFAIEQVDKSIPLNRFAEMIKGKSALVFGNEVTGVEADILAMCEGCIEIPQFGTKHSLNISVAAGIVLWEVVRSRMDQLKEVRANA